MQVRVTSTNKVRNYISYAVALLEEKGHSSVVLKAMGQAINKAVVVGETQPQRPQACCTTTSASL
jgi:DNA-binding protein